MIDKKRIAIVGAGIFGSTVSIRLAQKGYYDLYEKNNSIMNCASRVNQYRLHKGYHYPRSDSTINQLLNSHTRFIEEYYDAIEKYTHLYALAKENSLTKKNTFNF